MGGKCEKCEYVVQQWSKIQDIFISQLSMFPNVFKVLRIKGDLIINRTMMQ